MSRGFSTLTEQIAELRDFSRNPKQRTRSGFESIDIITEGPAAGEVFTFMGRSFTGKSLVATNIMANNPDTGIIFFSLEMPARQALQRLYATWGEVPHRDVIEQTKRGSLPHVLDTLAEGLPKQVIVDRPAMTLGDMSFIVGQYEEYFGERPAVVIIDYLELVGGGKTSGEGWTRTEATAGALKDWSKSEDVGVFLLHQTNRTEPEWEAPTADSARGAGFTESDAVIGMWQPSRNPKLSDWERQASLSQVYFNVLKNRVTGRTTDGRPIVYTLSETLRFLDDSADATRRFYERRG